SAFDTNQRYTWLNDAACDLMGVEEEALIGQFYGDANIVRDDRINQGFLLNLREVTRTGAPVRYETFGKDADDGREHAWSLEMWPVRDDLGAVVSVGIAAFDSSEQHWARRRLALLNEAAAGIGTTLDVVRTAEELVELVVPRFADFVSVDLLDWVLGADEPTPAQADEVVLHRVAHGSVTEGTTEGVIP
ncbi:PAS domain-containing protein, partial [Streptomyces sp. SID13666]|uniref:PAS domain-containing protein n=1 Tax=Streptomyces sp. SID13666 TaxID=2706054 RepID=UPI0013C21739